MKPNKIQVYFMPGMAASPEIFEHIKLPEETYEIYFLEWMIPDKKESLQEYARRMCHKINHENIVFISLC